MTKLTRRKVLALGAAIGSGALVPRPVRSAEDPVPSVVKAPSAVGHPKKFVEVLGKRMAYVEMGEGAPIVFLHGNPTSSYLWRNVMPHLAGHGRLIAPDLIGMGDSEKLDHSGPGRYRFFEHRDYLDALLETLGVRSDITFIIHDWGSALGFDWANGHRNKVKGIAYMEAIVHPMTWEDDFPEPQMRQLFQGFRSPAGETMILERNLFVEAALPAFTKRKLSAEEMAEYRRPFQKPGEDRRPTLTWPRDLPIEGQPPDVVAIVEAYGDWLKNSELPKLFINAQPGAIIRGPLRVFCRSWKNQIEVTVEGIHFVQEDAPDQIGQAIAKWRAELG